MSFADNLIHLRQHYGVTQEGLAEQLSVSRQTISKWEAGTNYPEMDKLLALCDLFHTNLDDLMRGNVCIAQEGDTERYDAHMNRFTASIVAGVMLIIAGVGLSFVPEAFRLMENLMVVIMLSFVVIGVIPLIVGGLSHGEFKRRNPTIEPRYNPATLERFSRRYPIMIAAGVGIILLDVIFLVGFTEVLRVNVRGMDTDALIMVPFILLIALAVGMFVWTAMQKSKYDLSELTYITHRQNLGADVARAGNVVTPEQIRSEHIISVVCGCIMLVATIIFLVWGFLPIFDQVGGLNGLDKDTWKQAVKGASGFSVSWIVFVVAGILCGIVCLVGSVFTKSKEDLIAEARQEDAWIKVAPTADAPHTTQPQPPAPAPGDATQPQPPPPTNPKTTWR